MSDEKGRQMSKELADDMDLDELRLQQFAIRSFTESVDDDDLNWPLPPTKLNKEGQKQTARGAAAEEEAAAEKDAGDKNGNGNDNENDNENDEGEGDNDGDDWGGGRRRNASGTTQHSECGTMRESSTADTIVEVLIPNLAGTSKAAILLDPSMGETQKYVMTVPGPELVDQEFELHKSLVNNEAAASEDIGEEDELDGSKTAAQNAKGAKKKSAFDFRQKEMLPHAAASVHSPPSAHFAPRPRPITPTGLSFLRIESFTAEMAPEKASSPSSFAVSNRMPPDSFTPKMHVVIPIGRGAKLRDVQRRYSTGQRDICDPNAPGGDLAAKARIRCGSTAAWSHGADIIESNPEFAGKAPPTPVEHRRSSREWQSFDDGEDEVETAKEAENDGEFVRALEEVRHLIEEVGQKLHQEDAEAEETNDGPQKRIDRNELLEKDAQKLSRCSVSAFHTLSHPQTTAPIAGLTAATITPPTVPSDDTSIDAAALTMASTSFEANGDGQMTRVPVRAAPPPPPATTNLNQIEPASSSYVRDQTNLGQFVTDQQHLTEVIRIGDNGIGEYPTDPTPAANPFAATGETNNPFGIEQQQINDQQQQQYYAEQQHGAYSSAYDASYEHRQYEMPIYATTTTTTTDYDANYDVVQQQQQQYSSSAFGQMTDYGSAQYGNDHRNDSTYGGYGMAAGTADLSDNVQYDTQPNAREYDAQRQEVHLQYGTSTDYTQYASYGGTSAQPPLAPQQMDFVQYGAPFSTEQYADNAFDCSKYGAPISVKDTATSDICQYGTARAANPFISSADQSVLTEEEPPVDTSMYGVPPARPTASFLAQASLFAAPRARTPDPFSWEAQENASYQTGGGNGTTMAPKRPPTPPSSSRMPGIELEKEIEVADGAQKEESTAHKLEKKAPPARPPNAVQPPPCRPPAPSPARPPVPPSPRPTRKAEQKQEQQQQQQETEAEEEEDAWKRFHQMTQRVGEAVKSTEQRLGELDKQSAAVPMLNDAIVQEYLSHTGGGTQLTATQRQQIAEQEVERKRLKQEKKRKKLEKGFGQLGAAIGERVGALKRAPSPPADPKSEMDLEKAAADLAKKIAEQHGFELKTSEGDENEAAVKALEKTEMEEKMEKNELMIDEEEVSEEEEQLRQSEEAKGEDNNFEADFSKLDSENPAKRWAAALEQAALMPPSDSDVNLAQKLNRGGSDLDPFDTSAALEGLTNERADPFAPMPTDCTFVDPFEVIPVEELIANARQKVELERAEREAEHEGEFLAESRTARPSDRLSTSHHSSPTPEGGSPVSSVARPVGFDDDFKGAAIDDESPLFDDDDSQPLPEFPLPFAGDGWELLLRYPPKKKLMADRFWKPIYVRIRGNMLAMFTNREEIRPAQEILIQANYSLSDIVLQPYDVYSKIHTVKLQHILYKERIGIRPGQISRLVEGHLTKYGLPLEHAAQCTVLAKFGSLNEQTIGSFTDALENVLFRCPAKRETAPTYRQDEVQIHCYDEYEAKVDKDGNVSEQRARVRLFCLSFLSGSPLLDIGLNDRRREGKEVVRRKDILPMYTERWIRFEAAEFHETVDKAMWEEEQMLRIQPPDGCFFEVMRFRVRPPRNRERPLSVKCVMRMAGSQVELRIDAMAIAQQQRARGTVASTRAVPCEDIAVRFPLPEAWIYLFREQRTWGVGSVHSKQRKPGKVKNLRDKLMGTVQHNEPCLIEVGIGEAKYEHLYHSLVWRIPRLPERDSAIYKSYMLKCRFELSSFDLMPEHFEPRSVVEFTMPLAVISNSVVRSVGVEQHEDSESVEKFVRYVAKCKYSMEIDYQQCADLDIALPTCAIEAEEPAQSSRHLVAYEPKDVQSRHEGYRIELPDDDRTTKMAAAAAENGDDGNQRKERKTSSSSSSSGDEADERKAFPVIQIDMKGYGY